MRETARGMMKSMGKGKEGPPIYPLTIDEIASRLEPTPLNALSWKDESHPQ